MAEFMIAEALQSTDLAPHVRLESYATSDWERGNPMDRRAQSWLRKHHVGDSTIIGRHTSQPLDADTLYDLDLVLALDVEHLEFLERLAQELPADPVNRPTMRLLGSFNPDLADATREEQGIFDPWYGGPEDFEKVADMIRPCIPGVIQFIRREHAARGILNAE
jgi:protein-tyrosine phosphatase